MKSWKGINKKESRILTTSKLITCWETLKLADSKFLFKDMFVASSHSPVAVGHSWSITQRAVATTQWWGRMEAARYSGTQFFFCSNPYQHRTRFFFIRCISYPLKYLQKVYIEEATKTKFKTFIFASMMLRSQHLWQDFTLQNVSWVFFHLLDLFPSSQAGSGYHMSQEVSLATKKESEASVDWNLTEDGQCGNFIHNS